MGVTVGPDGSIYVAIAYMAHNEGSPIYASDLVRLTFSTAGTVTPPEHVELTARSVPSLYADLSQSSWEIRRHAHLELLRRGGNALQQAAERLRTIPQDDPARAELIWLAAADRSKGVRDQLIHLADDPHKGIRLQSVRALHAFFSTDSRAASIFSAKLTDADPQMVLAATGSFFDASPVPLDSIARVARSADTYLRQCATRVLAERAPFDFLKKMCASSDDKTRLAGVLAAGFRLTLPPPTKPIDPSLPLAPWPEDAVYHVRYLDETIDLRMLGRIGMFTVAEHWNASKHSAAQESLFALLQQRLDDSAESVRLEAAYFLSLLNDPRVEPAIARLHKRTERARLANAPLKSLGRAWAIGPFDDGTSGLSSVHPPETGPPI